MANDDDEQPALRESDVTVPPARVRIAPGPRSPLVLRSGPAPIVSVSAEEFDALIRHAAPRARPDQEDETHG
jgi:hypothetical protein